MKEFGLFQLPEQDVGIHDIAARLKELLDLKVADQTDKYASHFLKLRLHKLDIWFSFDKPIAFSGRGMSAVLQGVGHNSDMHSFKAAATIRADKSASKAELKQIPEKGGHKSMRSEAKFNKLLTDEIKKEIIHTSSEVMSSTLGA